MRYRSPARFVAPLALVAFAVVAFAVARGASGGDSEKLAPKPTTSVTTGARSRAHRTYTVKPGDILSVVAEHTGVPVGRIEDLNPGIDPNALRPGQHLKLSP